MTSQFFLKNSLKTYVNKLKTYFKSKGTQKKGLSLLLVCGLCWIASIFASTTQESAAGKPRTTQEIPSGITRETTSGLTRKISEKTSTETTKAAQTIRETTSGTTTPSSRAKVINPGKARIAQKTVSGATAGASPITPPMSPASPPAPTHASVPVHTPTPATVPTPVHTPTTVPDPAPSVRKASSSKKNNPRVLVSIAPFHALVSAVMKGVGEPELLVKTGASPHHYNLRPSEINSLQNADIIFWGGPDLETFLVKPLNSLEDPQKIVELDKTTSLLLLSPRRTVLFNHSSEEHGCCDHSKGTEAKDMHFWLDPTNAKYMVNNIVERLSQIDPKHQAKYRQNAKNFIMKLEVLDRKLQIKLKPVQSLPYVVFHDAYQYFEHHYGLKGVGSITLNPELPISLQRLQEIRACIIKTKAVCVFKEPQFKSQLVESISQDTGSKIGELDPLGKSQSKDGSDYLNLMENLADSLKSCLETQSQESSPTPAPSPIRNSKAQPVVKPSQKTKAPATSTAGK